MKSVMAFFKKPVKKYGFPPWLERLAMPALGLAGFVLVTGVAHATAMDAFGAYINGGFTGPLPKGIATGLIVLGSMGLKHTEGRAHMAVGSMMIASGGVLAAPLLTTEFQHSIGGILLLPSLLF